MIILYIDEVQDFVGYDLDIILLMFKSNIKVLLVGDTRQLTYQTHYSRKNRKYLGEINSFF